MGILDRDLLAAGIARIAVDAKGRTHIDKTDERGRTLDVHSLRTTFATHLSKGGVAPRTAQAALRHSTVELTMQTYTDPKLLDVAGALNVLPYLPLDSEPNAERQRATGTMGTVVDAVITPRSLVPVLVPTAGNSSTRQAIADTSGEKYGSMETLLSGSADMAKVCVTRAGKKAGGGNRTRMTSLEG